uniref:Small integral membrane protein 29 n=1 Tax=Octopus bimaculoides TaxID=37653 RepID=A0A0L8G7Z5_OCTBM
MSLKFGAAQAPAEQAGTPPTNYVIREPSPPTSILATLHATSTVSSSTSTISTELEGKHTWAYILVPLGAIVFLGFVIFLIVVILKKNRLDKLRHHLMPLYSFDPAAVDEDQDWECELLDGDKEQHVALRSERCESYKSLLQCSHGSMLT